MTRQLTRHERHMAELSFLYGIALTSDATDNSKLAGLQRKLQKLAGKLLIPGMKKIPSGETYHIESYMRAWGVSSGWANKSKHVGSMVSFCAQMMEDSPNKFNDNLYTIIVDIVDHLNHANNFYPLSIYAGQTASDKWINLFKEK